MGESGQLHVLTTLIPWKDRPVLIQIEILMSDNDQGTQCLAHVSHCPHPMILHAAAGCVSPSSVS